MYQYTLKNKSNYIVRKALETDLEQLIEVMLEVAQEDDIALLTFAEASSKIIDAKERLRTLIANDSAHFFYLVGWADFKTFQIYIRMAGIDVKGVTDNFRVMPKVIGVLSNFLCKFNLALKPRKGFLKSNWVSLPVNFHS